MRIDVGIELTLQYRILHDYRVYTEMWITLLDVNGLASNTASIKQSRQ